MHKKFVKMSDEKQLNKAVSENDQTLAVVFDGFKKLWGISPHKMERLRKAIYAEFSAEPFTDDGMLCAYINFRNAIMQIGFCALQDKLVEWSASGEINMKELKESEEGDFE